MGRALGRFQWPASLLVIVVGGGCGGQRSMMNGFLARPSRPQTNAPTNQFMTPRAAPEIKATHFGLEPAAGSLELVGLLTKHAND